MTVPEVCDRLRVSKSALYRWWVGGDGPRFITLPGGQRRVRRSWLDDWEQGQEG